MTIICYFNENVKGKIARVMAEPAAGGRIVSDYWRLAPIRSRTVAPANSAILSVDGRTLRFMGFLEFMLGKRLIDDEVDRFARNVEVLAHSDWARSKRARGFEKKLRKQWAPFLAEALSKLDVDGSMWVDAGQLDLSPSGALAVPPLPANPGIVRMEMIGPEAAEYVVLLSEHASMKADESEWAADPDAGAHMLAGGQFAFSDLDTAAMPNGSQLDLSSAANRQALVRMIEQAAERSGYWLLHPLGDRNALILDTERLV
jgi:hypothetical protein